MDRLKCSLPTCPPGSTTARDSDCWVPHETTRGHIESLAAALGIAKPALIDLANAAETQYTHFTIAKANGKPRYVSSPHHDLKLIQKRINRSVFGNVDYPGYLFGGIEGRDYVLNARIHANSGGLIALDIKNFYPSIQTHRVREIFKYFCKFPDAVADLLTKLTTVHGAVPQGACTSSHLANLVFHDTEHRIVRDFLQQGLRYTRLLDDISISSLKIIPDQKVTKIIDKARLMLSQKGFKLRADKTRVTSTSNPEKLMEVTGLWLNRGQPRAHRSERVAIRAEVRRCERSFDLSRTAPDYHAEHNRASGRISKLSYLGHFEAKNYRARLETILPMYDQTEINRTLRLVKVMCATPKHDRSKLSFIDRFHEVMYRLGILARSHPHLAAVERAKMATHCPSVKRDQVIYGTDT